MQRIKELDGWRACAVCGVLMAHFFGFPLINLGRLGVELFFVLSGRLMAEILFVQKAPIKDFYIGRLSRVYPTLIVFAVSIAIFEYLLPSQKMTLPLVLSVLTMTINYGQFWLGHGGVFGHIWSLCVEVHVYLLLGLVAFLSRRTGLPATYLCISLLMIFIFNGIYCTYIGLDYYQTYWRSDVRGGSIIIGCLCFLVLHDRDLTKVPRWLPLALLTCGVLLNFNAVPDPLKYTAGTLLLAMTLMTLPRAPDPVLSILRHPWTTTIGLISYSVYLWQQPFWRHTEHMVTRAAALPFALALAFLSYRLVEGPARRWLNRHWKHRRDDGPVSERSEWPPAGVKHS